VAVVNAAGITDELASRAWWALQTPENARCMLRQEAVVRGRMGPVLAGFLVEFLPFEEDARDQIRSVRLVLQDRLIADEERLRLWSMGRHRNTYYVGFLQATPDDLPESWPANPAAQTVGAQLAGLLQAANPYAVQLTRLLSAQGQSFLACADTVLNKPSNQDVMVELMHALAQHARELPLARGRRTTLEDIRHEVDALLGGADTPDELATLVQMLPDKLPYARAMLMLALLDEPVLDPVFSRTDAIGSVMRKKLRPVIEPVREQIRVLMQ